VTLSLYTVSTLTTMAGMEIFGWTSAALVLVLLTFFRGTLQLKRPVLTILDYWLLPLCLVIIVGAFFAESADADKVAIIGRSRFVILFLLLRIGLEIVPKAYFKTVLTVMVGVVGVIGVYAIVQRFTGIDLVRGPGHVAEQPYPGGLAYRAQGLFNHPVRFAHTFVMSLCFPFAIVVMGERFSKKLYIFAVIALILGSVGLIWSYTRGAWFSLAAAYFIMAVCYRMRVKTLIILAAIAVIAVVFSSGVMLHRAESITDVKYESNALRLNIWKANIQMFKDHPLMGVGYGINEDLNREYFDKMGIKQEFTGHAHNTYLQFLAGTGLPGFLLFLGFSLSGLWIAFKNFRLRRDDRDAWVPMILLAALGAQIAMQVGGLTETNFKNAETNHHFMLIVAVMLIVSRMPQSIAVSREPFGERT
jgi:putative inorganic carbon (HCO3(-)) transporter